MIICVVVPVLLADIYCVFYLESSRQLFWEYVENIILTGFLLALMAYEALKKTKKMELSKVRKATPDDTKSASSAKDMRSRDIIFTTD